MVGLRAEFQPGFCRGVQAPNLLFLLWSTKWSGQDILRFLPKVQARSPSLRLSWGRTCPSRLRRSSRGKQPISPRRILKATALPPHPTAPFAPRLLTGKSEAPSPVSLESPFTRQLRPSAKFPSRPTRGLGLHSAK